MNTLNFPTDSLYKFLAIAGLILATVPLIFLYNEAREFDKQIMYLRIETDTLGIESKYLKEKVVELMEQVGTSTTYSQEESKEFLNESNKLKELNKQIEIKNKELENKLEFYSLLNNELKELFKLIKLFLIIGSVLSFLGFFFWYTKVQVYQDKLLKKDSNK